MFLPSLRTIIRSLKFLTPGLRSLLPPVDYNTIETNTVLICHCTKHQAPGAKHQGCYLQTFSQGELN